MLDAMRTELAQGRKELGGEPENIARLEKNLEKIKLADIINDEFRFSVKEN